MEQLKILVLSSKEETLPDVLKVANNLEVKSGPFACALLLSHVPENTEALLSYDMKLPTYIASGKSVPDEKNHQSYDICKNLTILSGSGFIKLVNGLKLCYVADASQYNQREKEQLLEAYENLSEKTYCDILLSYQWSTSIARREKLALGDAFVDKVATQMKPRYHFSGQNLSQFFELDPFFWDKEQNHTCRFINVAQFKSGAKWAYAFKIAMPEDFNAPQTTMIENPYIEAKTNKRKLEIVESTVTAENGDRKQRKVKQVLPSECRFCLSNNKLNEHMIIAISKFSYITIAKGPLSTPIHDLDFSGHCLLIPIEHIPKLNSTRLDTPIIETEVFKDLNRFEETISEMNFKRYDMSSLVFEINSSNGIHFHKQLIPIPKYLIDNFQSALSRQIYMNNEKFKGNAKLEFKHYDGFTDEGYLNLINDHRTNYFQFTIRETATSTPKVFISVFDKDDRIDLQFGRRVAAFLLKQPKRTKWDSKVCFQTKEQEEREVLKFQKSYKEFDFTLT